MCNGKSCSLFISFCSIPPCEPAPGAPEQPSGHTASFLYHFLQLSGSVDAAAHTDVCEADVSQYALII